jgi:uncharacterized protein
VDVEFDPSKDRTNIEKHGMSLARVADLDVIRVVERSRENDGERRFRLYGLLDEVAHCAVITHRGGRVRAISLRKASRAERKLHDLR